ncbi:oligopeptide transport system substrate-binding protein [Hydrogenispora ethanolica]|jgi:oligopeptide transport system substrate-binding protein|uniref:Oligopeptide transport system substrate-binding protein n=1 Tax=Hydrogenispora ethanolica TaxID=1082276 RepID=A0A4R1RQ40_HYDET|nr:peptide ABC transporter substrate-binding protein [Hydrogenispora ethanolica]TCL68495.1 oligopeptide transport system substrate-binding protein [Hydrogenispora ethanolica]
MKMTKWLLLLAVVVFIGSTVFAAAPKLAKVQELRYNNATEPQTIDPARSTGVQDANIELAAFEGLTRTGENDVPIPGIAYKWEIAKDGLTYTFHLRKTARWSNGQPVTAHDFEYSWKRALDPKLAAEYAYQLYYIKNGEAYNTKKITDANQIGVKALDNYTLKVTLEAPCSYFLAITAFPTLLPVNKKVVEANPEKWATDPKTYIGNGPFKMVRWVHNERIEYVPNPYYWNRKAVKLTKLTFYLIEEQSTALTMYDSNQVDMLDENSVPHQEIPRLESTGTLMYSPFLGTYFYRFNTKKAPFNNVKVRKAFALAIDRALLVKVVTKGGQKPAYAFVPFGVPDAAKGATFRKVGGNFFKDDLAAAKKLLAEAGYPDGKGFPTVELLYNTSEQHKQVAEAIQEMWKKNLGINITLTNQEWKVYLDNQQNLNYTVCRAGWLGDYVDPMTFMDMFVTNGGNNQTGWSNAQYDKLIDIAKSTGDQKARMKAMHDAEKILMDEMPIMPIYFYTNPTLMKSYVKGVNQSALGMVYFDKAYIARH